MNVSAWRDVSRSEPGLLRAAVLAVLVHLVFFAFMVFGLSWKNDPPETMIVDLWSDLPQPVKPVKPLPVIKETPPKPEPVKQPPQPVKAKPEPVKETAPPKPEPVKQTPPKPEPIKVEAPAPLKKPAIEIKDKTQKPSPVKEDTKKPEPVKEAAPPKPQPAKEVVTKPEPVKEKAAKPEAVKESPKKPEIDKEKLLKEQQQAEQIKKQQQEQEATAQRAAAEKGRMDEIAKYKAMIQAKIRSRIVMPPELPGNPVVEFRVTLLPGGEVLNVMLRKSSGYAAFDEAVERAIFLSTPLPIPPDPGLFRDFRDFSVTVYYRETF